MQATSERLRIIYRNRCFSPNSLLKDKAILDAVAQRVDKERLAKANKSLILSMGRQQKTLKWLKGEQERGAVVLNRAEGVEKCTRSVCERILRQAGMPLAPAEGGDGYWIKRGDAAAQTRTDVQFAATREELERKKRQMEARGISDYVVTAHVRGDLVKFYGVRETAFFRFFYPTDDGQSKFGDEALNGKAHHYAFDEEEMKNVCSRAAGLLGVDIYGGDCIVKPDGEFCIIDFNDWPSFGRCLDEAADAITELIWKRVLGNC